MLLERLRWYAKAWHPNCRTRWGRVPVNCWDAYDAIEKPGFQITTIYGDVSQSYRRCYCNIADHKRVVSIKKIAPALIGTRRRGNGDVLKNRTHLNFFHLYRDKGDMIGSKRPSSIATPMTRTRTHRLRRYGNQPLHICTI